MRDAGKALISYLVIVTILCAGFILTMKLMGQEGYYLAQGYMMTPAIAAIITRLFFCQNGFRDAQLRIGRWSDYLRFWGIGLGIVALYLASFTLLGAIRWDLTGNAFLAQLTEQMAASGQDINNLPNGMTPQMMLLLYFVGGLTVFNILPGMITGFGEEFGWRGLMFPLMYRIRPWVAFIIGGLVWFGWHVPLTLVIPQSQSLSPLETLTNTGILAVGSLFTFAFLAYVYIKSQSVFVVSVAHITLDNASRSFSYFVILENQILANLGLAISMAIVIAALYYLGELRVFKDSFSSTSDLAVRKIANSNG